MKDRSTPIHHTGSLWTKDFILIGLTNFIIYLGFQMLLPTIPVYAKHLGGNATTVGMVLGVFALSALGSQPAATWLRFSS